MFEIAEAALIELAATVVPKGSTAKAVANQWLHAYAKSGPLYGANHGLTHALIQKVLKDGGAAHKTKDVANMLSERFPLSSLDKSRFKFIDLFAGIGGMRLGFQSAGGMCVFSSEFEKNAQQTYFDNHGDYPFGDITQVPAADIPDHDVLIAGFPCQPFSHAGLKLGILDTRGTLFHNIAQILSVKKPKFALLENVKGLISHDAGYTLQVILKTLIKIGYRCNIPKNVIEKGSPKEIQDHAKKMVLRSRDFGVPQNRQRIYIVLWRGTAITQFEYPAPSPADTRVSSILEANPDPKYRISDRLWEGHQRRKMNNGISGKGFGFGLVSPASSYTNTISARYYKDGSEILIDDLQGKNPRKLTPREAANLQGFPNQFILNKSDVQCYKQFGNSVTVPVISELAKNIAALI